MKVLILATDIYARGGIARYTASLVEALGDTLGTENICVLALLGNGGPRDLASRFRIQHVTEANRPSLSDKLRFAGQAANLRRERFDLIICTHLAVARVALILRLLCQIPFWVVCYGSEAWQRNSAFKDAALRQAALVVADSEFTAGKLRTVLNIPPGKVKLLYNAIPDALTQMLLSRDGAAPKGLKAENGKLLLSVGSLSKVHAYKGFDTVIRALPQVLRKIPSTRYLIVGSGDDRPRLEALAEEVNVRDRVTFAGEVSDGELAACYRACDAFVLPSRSVQRNGRWEGEGFGRVYIEAALAGKPVVGSRDGGAAEAVLHGRSGFLVEPSSAEEISAAVSLLFENPKLACQMGSRGRQWALEKFTAERMRGMLRLLLVTCLEVKS
jgi:phosphatidyl-myo-inositol dimannoside synthase